MAALLQRARATQALCVLLLVVLSVPDTEPSSASPGAASHAEHSRNELTVGGISSRAHACFLELPTHFAQTLLARLHIPRSCCSSSRACLPQAHGRTRVRHPPASLVLASTSKEQQPIEKCGSSSRVVGGSKASKGTASSRRAWIPPSERFAIAAKV